MGLTGILLSAKFKVQNLKSNSIIESSIKTSSLKETMEIFNKKHNHKYIVAWLDMSAKYNHIGRGVVYFADHGKTNLKRLIKNKTKFQFSKFFLNSLTFQILNKLFYFKNKKTSKKVLHLNKFFYTLDNILLWNRFYGKRFCSN